MVIKKSTRDYIIDHHKLTKHSPQLQLLYQIYQVHLPEQINSLDYLAGHHWTHKCFLFHSYQGRRIRSSSQSRGQTTVQATVLPRGYISSPVLCHYIVRRAFRPDERSRDSHIGPLYWWVHVTCNWWVRSSKCSGHLRKTCIFQKETKPRKI